MRSAHTLLALFLTVPLATVPLAAAGNGDAGGQERVTGREFDNHGRLLVEYGLIEDSDILFERHFRYAESPAAGGNGNGNGGSGQSSDGSHLGTSCASDAYRAAPWRWTSPYSATASAHASVFNTAGNTWDVATSADIFGSITSGSAGVAGQFDNVNQIDFAFLGSGGTIAVTTTWYNRFTGVAVESDGQYNTYYPWSTSGAANAMDVLNIGTHEIGHTFGLDHPKGAGAGCLTMYAYSNYGETQKRDLGDGDIVGIQAKYGA